VDVYNAVCLKYGVPCGAEDIDTIEGDLRLTIAQGGEEFYLIGSEENDPALSGEVIYLDDRGAVCRCYNWRECKRTMVKDRTKNIFMIIEMVNRNRVRDLDMALGEIRENVIKYLGKDVSVENHFVTKDNPDVVIMERQHR
jgi:DNA/RNA-binding domain of Phe-tRNA-synthetase-like protein